MKLIFCLAFLFIFPLLLSAKEQANQKILKGLNQIQKVGTDSSSIIDKGCTAEEYGELSNTLEELRKILGPSDSIGAHFVKAYQEKLNYFPNHQRAMGQLVEGVKLLEQTASKILVARKQLNRLPKNSPQYERGISDLTDFMMKWGFDNGLIRHQIDLEIKKSKARLDSRKKPLKRPPQLAYLYDLKSPPNSNYLLINSWFLESNDSKDRRTQVETWLAGQSNPKINRHPSYKYYMATYPNVLELDTYMPIKEYSVEDEKLFKHMPE